MGILTIILDIYLIIALGVFLSLLFTKQKCKVSYTKLDEGVSGEYYLRGWKKFLVYIILALLFPITLKYKGSKECEFDVKYNK